MAFWGVEVKPGKPITHSCEKARGRLRISQATLGLGEATKKTVVQCNVGKRAPVLLCALLPLKTESCHLDLEFEEADDVVFSVIGPRSVHLTGYYVRQSPHLNPNSDTESYGVDIENTQTEGSSYGSDDDKYEDSFINDDDDLQVSPESPNFRDKGIDEGTPENEKPKGRMGPGKQRKKKFQVIESDNEDARLSESEDEDEYTLSAFKGKRTVKATTSDDEEKDDDVTGEVGNKENDNGAYEESKQKLDLSDEKVREMGEMGDEAKDNGVFDDSKQKDDPLNINDEWARAAELPLDEEGTDVGKRINDLPNPKEAEAHEGIISSDGEIVKKNNANDSITDKAKEQMQSHDLTKPKKKRKERSTREKKTCEYQTDNSDQNALVEDKEREVEASMNMETDASYAGILLELGSASDEKVKRRKTECQLDGPQTEEIDKKCPDIPEDDVLESLPHLDSNTKDLPAADGEYQEQHLEGTSVEGIDTKPDNVPKTEEFNPGLPHGDCMTTDPPASDEEFPEQQIDKTNPELVANDSQPGKKNKKKKKKAQRKRYMNTCLSETTNDEETTGDENTNIVPVRRRTLSNGLIIEELVYGPPDGKVAAPGKKVKVYYTGMMKENQFVFDSNVGKSPFKFRLGDKEYIDGWNVGIDGMRVGDKRRLIIPPSMGFGNHQVGELVPPNSWLVYDIELVGVRK